MKINSKNHLKLKIEKLFFIICLLLFVLSCQSNTEYQKGTFGYDFSFLKKHIDPIILSNSNSKIIVSPKLQGRVLSSTSNGMFGKSYGWLNYKLIESEKFRVGGNGFGGEDRFWLGPIGSKFSLYYNGKEIESDNWYVPKAIDIETYNVVKKTTSEIEFEKKLKLVNNINTNFNIKLNRQIKLFSISEIEKDLEIEISKNIKVVGFQSKNSIENIGNDWIEKNGIIAPWILGMFQGTHKSIGIFPVNKKENDSLTIQKYLAEIDKDKLVCSDSAVFYKTDGAYRSKIGINKINAKPIFGNIDFKNKVLTIITFKFNNKGNYLNCDEYNHSELYKGDVVSCYNNISENNVSTFFELESAASAKVLKNGERNIHWHNTYHFEGPMTDLEHIAKKLLGVSLKALKNDNFK